MNEYYKFLGVSEYSSAEEVTARYNELKLKYKNDMFLEGEAGNEAARNLTKLENAYEEIMRERRQSSNGNNRAIDFGTVEKHIKNGELDEAQRVLDNFNERPAEWHYLQSVVFYRRNWHNESKKQLEIALAMEPNNERYKKAYDKLCENMSKSVNSNTFKSGNAAGGYSENRQMGASDSWCDSMCSCCATWCLIDTLCSCCCR